MNIITEKSDYAEFIVKSIDGDLVACCDLEDLRLVKETTVMAAKRCGKYYLYQRFYLGMRCGRGVYDHAYLNRRILNLKDGVYTKYIDGNTLNLRKSNMIKTSAVDLTNQRFKSLLVLKKDEDRIGRWLVCCDCGNKKSVLQKHLLSGRTGSCGCKIGFSVNTQKREGYNNPISGYFNRILSRAQHDKIDFDLDEEYLLELYKLQNGKCAISGLPISFRGGANQGKTVSLDRIDSNIGYIKSNVQWVHKDVNRMKWAFEQEYFIEVCKKIAENLS